MKRHESLQDLSRDHSEALVMTERIRQAVASEEGADSVDEAARAFLAFWDDGPA